MSRMYSEVTPWNVAKGCLFQCVYCVPSFQAQAKRHRHLCEKCYSFEPHEHPERLEKGVPKGGIIWPVSSGDISFCTPQYLHRIVLMTRTRPEQTYYWQSKRPFYLSRVINMLRPEEQNHVLLTTLETNRDKGYEKISLAQYPTDRAYDFLCLNWPRKTVTVEPILDFDLSEFLDMLLEIRPEAVYIGYNSRPKAVQLPEPPRERVEKLIANLRTHGIVVKTKFIPWES